MTTDSRVLLSGGQRGSIAEVGVDVIALERLARVLRRTPRLFAGLCQPQERADWCRAEGEGLAWAALLWTSKEAAAKCLRTGLWRAGVDWPDLEVLLLDERGAPISLTDAQSSGALFEQDSSLTQRARSGDGIPLMISARRAALQVLDTDQLVGRFSLRSVLSDQEIGVCLMHREQR